MILFDFNRYDITFKYIGPKIDYFAAKCIILNGKIDEKDDGDIFLDLLARYPGLVNKGTGFFINAGFDFYAGFSIDKFIKIPMEIQPVILRLTDRELTLTSLKTKRRIGFLKVEDNDFYFNGGMRIENPLNTIKPEWQGSTSSYNLAKYKGFMILNRERENGQNISGKNT